MKKIIFAYFFILCSFSLSAQSTSSLVDEEVIKNTIISSTEHWINGNLEALTSQLVNKPYFLWTVTNGNEPGDVITLRGWDNYKNFMRERFQKRDSNFRQLMGKNKITRDQWSIQIRNDIAFVSFNQHTENEQSKMDSTETMVLEKIDGVWKIAMQTALIDFKDATPPIRTKY